MRAGQGAAAAVAAQGLSASRRSYVSECTCYQPGSLFAWLWRGKQEAAWPGQQDLTRNSRSQFEAAALRNELHLAQPEPNWQNKERLWPARLGSSA